MNKVSFRTRSVSLLAIAGLAFGMSAPLALAADPVTDPVQAAQGSMLVDPNKSVSLTIHKFANPTATPLENPTGTAADADRTGLGTALSDVGFTIYKVDNVDITTNAGLAAAGKLKAADFLNTDGSVDLTQVTKWGTEQTTVNGKTTFEVGKEQGVYLVVETSPKAGYSPAAPFLAYLPMTSPNATDGTLEWNYNVHAVPKNYSKKKPVKTVVDQNDDGTLDNAGDEIEYTIDTQTRVIPAGKRLAYYKISDSLDRKNFDINAADTAITVSIKPAGAEGYTTLVEDVDYTLTKDAKHNSFLVDFTIAGLQQLGSNTDVRVSVSATKLTNEPVAPNRATEYEPSNPSMDLDYTDNTTPPTPGTPDGGTDTNTVYTPFGKVSFTKVDSAGNALAGAEFKLYQTLPGMTCSALDLTGTTPKGGFEVQAWDAADKGLDKVFQSDENGLVDISGLHVNDFANGDAVDPTKQTSYCLVETKAPAGKDLLAEPIEFQITKSTETQQVVVPQMTTTWAVDKDGNYTVVESLDNVTIPVPVYNPVSVTVGRFDGKVVNIDDTTPNLPMTGGAGVGILALIGAGIIGAGTWFARRGSKA